MVIINDFIIINQFLNKNMLANNLVKLYLDCINNLLYFVKLLPSFMIMIKGFMLT